MQAPQVVIIGAGVAGLVAARHLEEQGIRPTILEATDRVGGRIKTDQVAGFALDHGFQVLLTAYQEARRYLNYEALQLARFRPGAVVCRNGRTFPIVDPLREPSQLFAAALSPVGSIKDKFLVWKMTQELKRADTATLFAANQQPTTLQFLRDYGFGEPFINAFFRPFFGGIFLENELRTPAPMLQFVFKMFAEGHAALPGNGMAAIPEQLAAGLLQTTLRLRTRAIGLEGKQVRTDVGDAVPFDALIIATDPGQLLPRLAGVGTPYESTTTLYYRSPLAVLPPRLIALVEDRDNLVNNFCEVTTVAPEYAPEKAHLVSVTLRDIPTEANAEEVVARNLRQLVGRPNWALEPLGRYDIPRALPQLDHLTYDYEPTATRITEDTFLAGDQLLFGSLDAAMRSGRRAAEGVLATVRVGA